ncbi:DNA replication protein psf2 [Umbelopsis nana]
MALPQKLQTQFSPEEIQFIAANDPISIIPNFTMEKMDFIQASYGPFMPPLQAEVPIWLAVALKKNRKCTIVPPTWLSKDHLQETLLLEESSADLVKVPFHYMEIVHMLFDVAPDDIPDIEPIRKLLKDIRECRQRKTRDLLEKIDGSRLELHNMSRMEINEIRPLFSAAFNEMTKFPIIQDDEDEAME